MTNQKSTTATTLKLTPSESVTIRSNTSEALEVEGRYGPGGSPPPKHIHPAQDEHFTVLEGSLRVRIDGSERSLSAGDEVEIPRGAVHQMWNRGQVEARVIWRTSPGGRTESWFRSVDALHRSGAVGSSGMPGPLRLAVLLDEYRDVIRLAVGPDPLINRIVRVLAVAGRSRGHRAT